MALDKHRQAQIISKNLKAFRNGLGWNQARLAKEADISGAALSKIEKGESRVPTIDVLNKLANALRVESCEITGEKEPSENNKLECSTEFYRRFGVISELCEADQCMILAFAERLRNLEDK